MIAFSAGGENAASVSVDLVELMSGTRQDAQLQAPGNLHPVIPGGLHEVPDVHDVGLELLAAVREVSAGLPAGF